MRKRLFPIIATFLRLAATVAIASTPTFAQEPKNPTPKSESAVVLKPLGEIWEAAFVRDANGKDVKIGRVRTESKVVRRQDVDYIESKRDLLFEVRRSGAGVVGAAEIRAEYATLETMDGKMVGAVGRMWLAKDRPQTITATLVKGPLLQVAGSGENAFTRQIRYHADAVGITREQTLASERKIKAGDQFTYRYFDPQVTVYVSVSCKVEETSLSIDKVASRKVLRLIGTPEPLPIGDQKLQLPPVVQLFDPENYRLLSTTTKMPDLGGDLVLVPTTKSGAEVPNGKLPDLTAVQSIMLARPISGMHDASEMKYRIRFQGKPALKDMVAVDDRRRVTILESGAIELSNVSRRNPIKIDKPDPVDPAYLKSNYFINSDDKEIQRLSKIAVGSATTPWKKAQAIESFVRGYMRPAAFSEALAPADHVAQTRTGDCTEFSMLFAALCRAQGIPSRTAVGLVYVDNLVGGKSGFAFHMWTEVYVEGQWMGLDATLAKGSIGPGHIKISDQHWDKAISAVPLLPVKAFLQAEPKIEVIMP